MATSLLDVIPPQRSDDVIYFNPKDKEYPIGLNLFSGKNGDNNYLIASSIVLIFKRFYADSWGNRLEYLLLASVASLLECDNTSLLGITRVLSDTCYRNWVIRQIKDPWLIDFWESEFQTYSKDFLTQAISPIQNKVGQILLCPSTRNMLGQIKSKIDFRDIIDNKKIFIANLSKGLIGETNSNILGSIIFSKFQLSAMARDDIDENERVDYYLYIDEFQNFTTDNFVSALSELRKYRLNLVLAQQYSDQLKENIRKAVYGNVGTILSFRVGRYDAEHLSQEFDESHLSGVLTTLPDYEAVIKINQLSAQRLKCLPPLDVHYRNRENLIKQSRQSYASSRHAVEDKFKRWLER